MIVKSAVYIKTNLIFVKQVEVLGSALQYLNMYSLYDECYPSPPSNSIVIHPHQFFLPFDKVDFQKVT